MAAATPITILTGFLGAGKTTLILNLVPQLPASYKLCLLKNEFGDVAIDSQLAGAAAISGTRELLNGCICCNLVGQLGDALATLRSEYSPDRIVIETSGSAFPATLAMEINRLIAAENPPPYTLDGVISVIDVENWKGYEDTSVTAKMQAQYTDLVVFNKWENVSERRWDDCLDRLGDLDIQIPWVKSSRGRVSADALLGVDGALARRLGATPASSHDHEHGHKGDHAHNDEGHMSEVEVLKVTLSAKTQAQLRNFGVDLQKLDTLLTSVPKDEVYRIKAILYASSVPRSSDTGKSPSDNEANGDNGVQRYILNWAFGRWTFTAAPNETTSTEPVLQMTIVTALYESTKLEKRLENDHLLSIEGNESDQNLEVRKI